METFETVETAQGEKTVNAAEPGPGKGSFFKNYRFILAMLAAIVGGCVTGAVWPGAKSLEPLGALFINAMFCVVVPMVFVSISSAIANMRDLKRAGKIIGTTIVTFLVTAAIAAVLMYVTVRAFPVVTGTYALEAGEPETFSMGDMLVNFFTKPDFPELWSRKAMLPLIVAAVLFGFGIQMAGGPETMTAKLLQSLDECLMKVVKLITYYAPVGFFGFFAYLVAVYGPSLIGDYSRTLIVYYVASFVYLFVMFPLYARFGGGKGAAGVMFRRLFRPAVTAFGTCSSVATIPVNMEVAKETGISGDVSDIVLPLGATMHMDGSSMSAIIKVSFLFGIFGMDFTAGKAILAIVVAVFSSVAMSGIPGGGGVGELVLCTVFFPEQLSVAYPIAIALGELVDPPATMLNSAGDYVASFIVSRYVDGKDWLQKRLGQNI
ncbi:MAG TPA: dicarboxylate/amino acid:cation symporter [Terriglobales bacterium]|nr:dicarboxylate/amino acid:cation symporter [Terriglobales bacterium]